ERAAPGPADEARHPGPALRGVPGVISCRRLAELLLEFVERELPPAQTEEVRRHLEACPRCVAYADSYRRVILLGRRLPRVPPPPEVLHALRVAAGQASPGS